MILFIIVLIKITSGHVASLICFICPGQIKKVIRDRKNPIEIIGKMQK
jgi:hypothetical protein